MVRSFITGKTVVGRLDQMTRSLVAFGRWSLTPSTLSLETIRASDCGRPRRVVAQTRGRPRRVVAQTRGRPRQVLLYHVFTFFLT